MRRLLLYALLFSSVFTEAGVIELLKGGEGFSLQKHLKKDIGSVIPKSLKASDFIKAFENKDLKKALKLWQTSLAQSSFSKSSNGSALYSYLLFQNGFEALALNHLFQYAKPLKIDPVIHKLWKVNVNLNHPIWNVFYLKLNPEWSSFFSPEHVFRLGAKYNFNLLKDYKYIEELLSLPIKKDFDSFSLEWSLMLSLLKKGNMDSATKLLSWFLSQTKNSYRKDQIHLTIARLLADIPSVPEALEYYQKIKPNSYFWLLAQEEMAWLLIGEKQYSQAYNKALALNLSGADLSPSMLFVLALLQLKKCDSQGSFDSLMKFKTDFSGISWNIKKLSKTREYEQLVKELTVFYQSDKAYYDLEVKQPFYHLRKDQNLKNAILFYYYMNQKESKSDFKELIKKQNALIQSVESQIYKQLDFLLKQEEVRIQGFLKWFHVLEAEILYRNHVLKSSSLGFESRWSDSVSLYKSDGFLYFPFDRREIWRDELANYQSIKSEKCVQSSYKL